MSRQPSGGSRLHVAIISDNPETLSGLERYLRDAGVSALGTRNIGRMSELRATASAIVLFPDDFSRDAVARALTACRGPHPGVLPVLVTGTPQRFSALPWWPDDAILPLVVPKPAWSWTILDAIRAHLQGETGQGR